MDRPSCKIVIGLPSTKEELAAYVADPRGRDLLNAPEFEPDKYVHQIIEPMNRLMPTWRRYGARIYPAAKLADLAAAVREDPAAPLFLLSHWRDFPTPAIEFFDGMAAIDDVASAFPADFEGVIDLCICRSIELSKRIKSRCQRSTVKWVNVGATPAVWFHILTLALRLMHDQKIDYLYGVDQSLRRFRDGQ